MGIFNRKSKKNNTEIISYNNSTNNDLVDKAPSYWRKNTTYEPIIYHARKEMTSLEIQNYMNMLLTKEVNQCYIKKYINKNISDNTIENYFN